MAFAQTLTPEGEPQAMSTLEDLADRVERLLLRHQELRRAQALLEQQVSSLTHERDSLRSRLSAARSRIDALLDRLPAESAPGPGPALGSNDEGSVP